MPILVTKIITLVIFPNKSDPVFYDFINLTQLHNFTLNAQEIVFTFVRLPLFTVSFTGI